jgi:hypothetical protein
MWTKPLRVTILPALLLVFTLGGLPSTARAEGSEMNEPPLPATGAPTVSPLTETPRLVTLSLPDPLRIFLPLLVQSGPSLWVDTQNRQTVLEFYVNQYLSIDGIHIDWTGSQAACDPGTTSVAFRQAVLKRINFFRAMAGIPATVTFSDESNRLAQAAALMMSANRALNHTPPSNWICYSQDGHDGAGSSNLFPGMYSWDAISGYIRDPGNGNSAAIMPVL